MTTGAGTQGREGGLNLQTATRNWQTPNAAAEAPNLGSNIKNGPKSLLAQAELATPWQTPAAFQGRFRRQVGQTERAEELLPAQAESATERAWPTPQAHDAVGGKTPEQVAAMRARTGAGVSNLNEAATAWSTPRASDGEKGGPNQSFGAGGTPLPAQAAQWGTPTSRDWKDGASPSMEAPTNGLLGRQAPRMPMPGDGSSQPDPTSRRRLNPRFVEWLQGWPEGWVDLTSSTSSETA